MNQATQTALIAYLLALKEEGIHRIHVSSVIPQNNSTRRWSQFPDFTVPMQGVMYDRLSGWFFL